MTPRELSTAALTSAPGRREQIATVTIWGGAIAIISVLTWVISDIVWRGIASVSVAFFVTAPEDAGRGGGIAPILVSTMLILLVTLCVAIPLSLGTAIALTENTHSQSLFARVVRRCLDVLAAVPSIVFGLFGNAFFCVALGMGYSILSGGLTLACMVLPILIRTSEQAIRAVPSEHRLAAAALGLSRWSTLFRIVLPSAAPAIAAGLVLSIGRALAETAALLYTSGYVSRMPASLMDSGRSMSVHIYDLAMNVPGGSDKAYATALVLVLLLLVINATAVSLLQLAGIRLVPQAGRPS